MSGWADRKLQELADKKKDERDQNDKKAREHALAVAEAPQLWSQLLEVLRKETSRYNEGFPGHLSVSELAITEADQSCVMLHAPGSEIMLTLHRKVPKIYYEVKKEDGPQRGKRTTTHGSLAFDVQKNDEVWLFHMNSRGIVSDGPYDVPSAAGFLLDLLVE